ncbi:MAG TPA: tetratricopeptide repeat protein, partial [Rhodothermales bacterium]|nr:tetratricopeptide repeat protein [Rhodothermales bacterium]
PDDPAVWATWAYALHLTGRDDEAARAYRVALHLDSENTDVRFGLANIYLAQGQRDAALREYERVLDSDSSNVAAWINTGIAYAQSGDSEAAQQAWRKALHFDPQNQAARSYLARLQPRVR